MADEQPDDRLEAERWLERLAWHPWAAFDAQTVRRLAALADRLAAAGETELAARLRRRLDG